jgi:hypothetical protein
MTPLLSIIIPHKISRLNNEAMLLNIAMLNENTVSPFELIIDTESPKCPYAIWNETARTARGEFLVFSNTDVLMAPDWDVYMLACKPNTIVTGYLVEPGNIGVAPVNVHKDFGRSPASFRRQEFEDYALGSSVPEIKEERAWYMPCCVDKEWFLSTGGFDTSKGSFPTPLDIIFWDMCRDELGTKFLRADSWAYHFQNLSGRE